MQGPYTWNHSFEQRNGPSMNYEHLVILTHHIIIWSYRQVPLMASAMMKAMQDLRISIP